MEMVWLNLKRWLRIEIGRDKFPSTSCTRRRSSIVAVFDVVKEKKTKSDASTSNLLLTKEEGLEVYEDMVLGRSFEDMFMQFLSNFTLSLLFPLPYHQHNTIGASVFGNPNRERKRVAERERKWGKREWILFHRLWRCSLFFPAPLSHLLCFSPARKSMNNFLE